VDQRFEQHFLHGMSPDQITMHYFLLTDQFATVVCVFTLDRIGRRWTLYWGATGQGIAMFLAGGFSRLSINAREAGNAARAESFGAAAASMVFIFTAIFGATWLTTPWVYPAEIYPLAVRAKGNAFGVVGWSIGNGWLVSASTHSFKYVLHMDRCADMYMRLDPPLPRNVRCHRRKDPVRLRR
jgi:hypothetical protein